MAWLLSRYHSSVVSNSGRISSFDLLALDSVTFRTPKSHRYSQVEMKPPVGKGLLHLLTSFRWSRSEQGLNLPIGKRPPQPLRRAELESTKPKRTPEQVHHPHAGDDVIQLVILRQTIELPRPPEEEDVAQQAGK